MAHKFTITVRDILSFHKIDRILFDRVKSYGVNSSTARNIVALWLWLEQVGVNAILYLNGCYNHDVVQRFISEAEAILQVIRPADLPPPPVNEYSTIPFTSSLVSQPLTLEFFNCNCETVVKGMRSIMDGVGRLIFDENLNALENWYNEMAVRKAKEGEISWPEIPSELMEAYQCEPVVSSEDCRSIYITFSRGYVLSEEDIIQHFTEKWGDCMEKVMIERTTQSVLPMYGIVVFKSNTYVNLILSGEKLVKFMIKGKHLWARQHFTKTDQN